MKKNHLILITVFFFSCLIMYSCRRDIENFLNDQIVPSGSIEAAKIWHDQQTNTSRPIGAAVSSSRKLLKLRPVWNGSRMLKTNRGEVLVVPTREIKIPGKRFTVKRFFLFSMSDNQVKSGEIVELIGIDDDVAEHVDELLSNLNGVSIGNFNGAVIEYDINYFRLSSSLYKKGVKSKNSVKIKRGSNTSKKSAAVKGVSKVSVECPTIDENCYYWLEFDENGNLVSCSLMYCDSKDISGESASAVSGTESSADSEDPPVGGGTTETPPDAPLLPCPGDPIRNPTIAPTSAGKTGGRYGYTRYGGTQFHDGLDIQASPGNDLYSAYGGVVLETRASFAPNEYREKSYGNYVSIKTTLPSGETIILKYNHLNGVNVTVGQQISAGQKIGINGKTGNANSKGVVPHVHIQARKVANGQETKSNPELYMATKFDAQGNPSNDPC